MDIFFQDPTDIPLPPDEIRIRELHAEPYPDGRRVRIILEITPFQQRPNCEIIVTNEDGEAAASLSIIESIDAKMDFTVHLKGKKPSGKFTVSADIYYYEGEETVASEASKIENETHQLPSKINLVDQRQATFDISSQPSSG
jgi:hypothetical protein